MNGRGGTYARAEHPSNYALFAIDERLVHLSHSALTDHPREITRAHCFVDIVSHEPGRLIRHLWDWVQLVHRNAILPQGISDAAWSIFLKRDTRAIKHGSNREQVGRTEKTRSTCGPFCVRFRPKLPRQLPTQH